MSEWITHNEQDGQPVSDETIVEIETVTGTFYKRRAYSAIWSGVARYRIIEDDITTESTEPPKPTPRPPEGMAIQAFFTGAWVPAVSTGEGCFRLRWGGPMRELEDYEWRYLPAPPVWPERTKVWLALSSGEYSFAHYERKEGELVGPGVYVLHVEHRPEGV